MAPSRTCDWQVDDGPGLIDTFSRNVVKQPFGSGKKRCLSLYLASSKSSHDGSQRPGISKPPISESQNDQVKAKSNVFDY